MSDPRAEVTTPFWSGDLKAALRRLESEERREIAALDRRIRETPSGAELDELKQRVESVRERYAAERRRLEVEHGLTLFVGD